MDGFAQADRAKPPPRSPIVFTGASTIRMWKTERSFPGWATLNRGFGGSTLHESVHFFDQVIRPYAPKAVVLCAGGNDIAFGYSPQQVCDDFLAFVDKLHAYSPDTPLIFLSLMPTRRRWKNAAKVRETNTLIEAKIRKDDRIRFLDVATPFMGPDGLPMEHLFLKDKVHLNSDGYAVWTKLLQPLLIEAQRGKALGEFAGRVDLGPRITCLLFGGKDAPRTAVAWADEPTPLPKPLGRTKVTDTDGAAVTPTQLDRLPLFFEMPAIPAGWDAQRQAEMPMPGAIVVWPGGPGVAVKVESQRPVKLELENDLPGLALGATALKDGRYFADIHCGPQVRPGRYGSRLVARGTGWIKSWPIWLLAQSEVAVVTDAYAPGRVAEVTLTSRSGREVKVTVSVPPELGSLSESHLTVGEKPKTLNFTAADGFGGTAALTLKTDTGAVIADAMRPNWLDVPRAGAMTLDGRLNDWPTLSRIAAPMLAASAPSDASLHLAWSPEGLYLACRLYFPDRETCNPKTFWDWTTMELFLDTDPRNTNAKAATVSQFWLCPTPGEAAGTLRAFAGEARRGAKIKTNIYDDKRVKTALAIDDDFLVMEAFIPARALGAAPAAGKVWRGALTAQECVNGRSDVQLGWPATQERKVGRLLALWGELRFVEADSK